MKRIGIVGAASFYGPHYATLIADRPDASVTGFVVDPKLTDTGLEQLGRPTKADLEKRFECPLYETIQDLLEAQDLDGVIVASPTTRRADDAVTALEADIPVLTAKPAAASPADADRISTAARKSETPAMTTSPARFDHGIRELYERVDTGSLGKPIAIDATIRHDRVPADGIEHNAEHAPDQAGAVFAMGYYTADLVEWLSGESVVSVEGALENANTPHSSHPDIGVATVRLSNDVLATMRMQYATDCREQLGNWEAEVVGSTGIARTVHHGYEGIHWHAGSPEERHTEVFGRVSSPILEEQISAFLESIETGSLPPIVPSPSDVVSALQVCAEWASAAEWPVK
jgi:predicted dehydrogenase